jgi:hypothetical protein
VSHRIRILSAAAVLLAALLLLVEDVEPVPTWFYVFAWYPLLLIADTVAVSRNGDRSLFGSPRLFASVFGWSVVIWLAYEAVNLRIENWYYVFLPPRQGWRWLGIALSFATVIPAIVLAEAVLRAWRVGAGWRPRPVPMEEGHRRAAMVVGWIGLLLVVAKPTWFWPLVWGVGLFIADPMVYRLQRGDSLFADIEAGRWDRIARILMGGMIIGLVWEGFNYWARGKWIYTIPWFEGMKWFEMPPLGFLGFPVFALSGWSLYHLLAGCRVAAAPQRDPAFLKPRLAVSAVLALIFSYMTLQEMELQTISSTVPRLAELPAVTGPIGERLHEAGVTTPFDAAAGPPVELAAQTGLPDSTAEAVVRSARLATLRGIGTLHLAELYDSGVRTVCGLAASDPAALWRELQRQTHGWRHRPTAAEVRVWTRAADRACSDS